ncbi:TonB-dependent receptor [Brevundimonas sp. 3P9-tot-E]|uniref:TonB-dependent receptor n=1 Tax=unclassified Brevundimonas TaxID=2622653 RepID=UPI0039A297ED
MLWLPFASLVVLVQEEAPGRTPVASRVVGQSIVQDLDDPVRVDDIEVRGRRGAARVPPDIELDGAEIDALGAWDIGEVLKRMGETLGVGEEPMVIINGKRVANPGVFYGFPPDALMRTEVLPPEAAALYGGAPGQRVVNLVLQRRFASYDGRVAGSRPTQGGTSSLSGDMRRSAIVDENTHQLGLRVSHDTALRADERDRNLPGEGPEAGAITLRPRADLVSANVNLTRALGEWSAVFSLNGQTRNTRSVARLSEGVVESRRRNDSLGGSVGLSGFMAGWSLQANLTGQASRAREDGFTDTRNENRSLGLNATASRTLMDLPTGPIVANLNGNLMESRSIIDRDRIHTSTDFQTREGRGSVTIPLLKANPDAAAGRWIGDLQATFGASVRETSGGGGDELNGALAWTPRKGVRLNGVWSTSSDSISDIQRFEPIYYGAPRVVFDFRTGEAVEIAPILGGNPDLLPPRSRRLALTASLGPFSSWILSGNFGYHRAESTDGIGSLPDLTEDVEAAFPERFQRDAAGRLISIDYRPMNLSSSLTEGVTSSVNFSLPRRTRVGENESTVLRVALSHSFRIRDTVALLENLPGLDRLKGDGGGVSRQDARIMLDARRGRWGVNASANWRDGYLTRRVSGADGPGDLVTEPFTRVDLKVSFQVSSSSMRARQDGEDASPRRKVSGLQLNLEVENLFDARPGAHLGDGSPAPGYGRDIQDPIGRTVRLTLQRRF